MPFSVRNEKLLVPLFGILGIVSIIIQGDLLGHWSGFMPSSLIIQPVTNTRVFFLIGYTIASIITVCVKKLGKWQIVFIDVLFVVASFSGTVMFGLAYRLGTFSELIGIVGLFLCGVGYFGVTLSLYCELSKIKRLSIALWVIAISLFLKTCFGDAMGLFFPENLQIAVAAFMPIVSLASLFMMRKFGTDTHLIRYRSSRLISAADKMSLFYSIIGVSIIVAILRGLGHFGFWGTEYSGTPIVSVAHYAIIGGAFALYIYVSIMRNTNERMVVRFQPASLIVISGFLLYLLQDGFSDSEYLEPIFSTILPSMDLFVYFLPEAIVLTVIRATSAPVWQYQGISGVSYGIASIVSLFILQYQIVPDEAFIIIAIFLALVITIRPLYKNPPRGEFTEVVDGINEDSGHKLPEDNAQTKLDDPTNFKSAFTDYLCVLAKRYHLSERETDVFLLLAVGRSRPYISNELFVSDGTVKTHITHIYQKFNVHSRGELLSIVHAFKMPDQ